MLFNSYEFVFAFLPLSLFVYFTLNKLNLRLVSRIWLVVVSLVFYSWWSIASLPLILTSLVVNFGVGTALGKKSRSLTERKIVLGAGLLFNLGLLGYYKYFDFFISNINVVLNSHVSLLHLALPLGISFFTFQQIAYLVDSYKAETREYDFVNYALFVTFFPQLIMGPIVHHKEIVPQFEDKFKLSLNWSNVSRGLFIFSMGLAKKLILADPLTEYSAAAFGAVSNLTTIESWYASLGYVLSYYFDLSGYADMAIGIGLFFNITLPINFNSPYKARNFADYWRRWHITLSRFLSDYIYKNLGGDRKNAYVVYRNILLTFLVSGLWHGAGWTFIVWGLVNGVFVAFSQGMKRAGLEMNYYVAWALTFLGVILTRVLFVASSFSDAAQVMWTMFNLSSLRWVDLPYAEKYYQTTLLGAALLLSIGFPNSQELTDRFKPNLRYAALTALMFVVALTTFTGVKKFLYFQF